MESRTVAIGLIAVAAFSLLRIISQWRGMSRKRRGIDWDEHFIQQLRKAGVSSFEDHTVDFFFTVPNRAAGEAIGKVLRAEGFSIDMRQAPDSDTFSVDAQRQMRLAVPEMHTLRARFVELAAQHSATYDNWAVATKPHGS